MSSLPQIAVVAGFNKTYSAFLMTSDWASTMRSQQAASDYQSEKEDEVQEERVIYGTARDTSKTKKHHNSNNSETSFE